MSACAHLPTVCRPEGKNSLKLTDQSAEPFCVWCFIVFTVCVDVFFKGKSMNKACGRL